MGIETNEKHSYLSFRLGDEIFASNVLKVKEILELTRITKVPHAPSYMKGVINLRGAVLPVIDARIKFGLPATDSTVNSCIMVLNIEIDNELLNIGSLVDSVLEVFEIHEDQIQPPPTIGNKYKSGFIYGMVKVDERFIMLLDMDKVFSTDELTLVRESTESETEVQSSNN